MAGLGFKDFQVGQVLTSSDVDGYLMQQTVMRFADPTARGSALGTAIGTGVALAQGMISYLDDIKQLQVYDGGLWRPAGSILQVVRATDTTDRTTTSQTYVTATINVTITPISASNVIYVYWYGACSINRTISATSAFGGVRIFDGTSALQGAEDVVWGATTGASNPATRGSGFALLGRYDPADTSPVTFTGQIRTSQSDSTTTLDNDRTTGQMIAMEVTE